MSLWFPSSKTWGSKHNHGVTALVSSEHLGLIVVEMGDSVDFIRLPDDMEVCDKMALHGEQ